MTTCNTCGRSNADGSQFCRYCGTRIAQTQAATRPEPPPSRRPYSWQTDEFQTHNETRPIVPLVNQLPPQQIAPMQYPAANQAQSPAYYGPGSVANFRCPYCGSNAIPRVERRMSSAGWITFALLLVFFFPLFWIGFLVKEDVRVCPVCGFKYHS